jgi:hypothetical protein
MPSVPAGGDATASAHVTTAGVSVSVQRSALPIASRSTNLLLSSRPLIILESLPLFPLWGLVIFLLYVFRVDLAYKSLNHRHRLDCL